LSRILTKTDPGHHLPVLFKKCSLHPVSNENIMEWILHRTMAVDNDDMKNKMNSSLGETLKHLRCVGDEQQPKKRGRRFLLGKLH
jgi:hypothetical protein